MRYIVVTPKRSHVFDVESGQEAVGCLLKEYTKSDKTMGDWNDRLIAHFVNQTDLTAIVTFVNSLTRYTEDKIIGIYRVSGIAYECFGTNK